MEIGDLSRRLLTLLRGSRPRVGEPFERSSSPPKAKVIEAAMRKLSDLVYDTVLTNAGPFFSLGNANLLTGVDTALGVNSLELAIAAMLTQRDAEGNNLDIRPQTLVVPPELQSTARAVLESEFITAPTNAPTGNSVRNAVAIEVEPRLSNAAKFGAKASLKAWTLFGAASASPVIVAFLIGRQVPTVEYFGLNQDANPLAASWRVYFDFGAALCERCGTANLSQALTPRRPSLRVGSGLSTNRRLSAATRLSCRTPED